MLVYGALADQSLAEGELLAVGSLPPGRIARKQPQFLPRTAPVQYIEFGLLRTHQGRNEEAVKVDSAAYSELIRAAR